MMLRSGKSSLVPLGEGEGTNYVPFRSPARDNYIERGWSFGIARPPSSLMVGKRIPYSGVGKGTRDEEGKEGKFRCLTWIRIRRGRLGIRLWKKD